MSSEPNPEIVTLLSPSGEASARVLVSQGCNLFELVVRHGGHPVHLLWHEEDFETGTRRASSSGTPILFPFPGRIQGTSMTFGGRTFPLEAGDGRGNAIHGFVHTRPWRVIANSQSHVTAEFHASVDGPEILSQGRWTGDFLLRATIEVADDGAAITLHVENPGSEPLPCGWGLHPYFRVPLGNGSKDLCTIRLPVTKKWDMVDMVATGRTVIDDAADRLREGVRFADAAYDQGFGGLVREDGGEYVATIADPGSNAKLDILFDKPYREIVIYNPSHREAVAIEPYTCICDPFRLEEEGVDAGLIVLQPGESVAARMRISLSALRD